jgi:hypothetical protein
MGHQQRRYVSYERGRLAGGGRDLDPLPELTDPVVVPSRRLNLLRDDRDRSLGLCIAGLASDLLKLAQQR